MNLRRDDRRRGPSFWRRLAEWILRERRRGWDRRARAVDKESA
jgi:hypothetical protein